MHFVTAAAMDTSRLPSPSNEHGTFRPSAAPTVSQLLVFWSHHYLYFNLRTI